MNPILTATNMTPNSTTAYTPVTLTFTGTNFVSSTIAGGGTLVTFNNVPLTGGTASAGGTSFSVQVPAFVLTTAGPATVTITNPLPGGCPTPAISFPFTINPGTIVINPSPILLFAFLGTTSTPATNVAVINSSASSATISAQSIIGANLLNFSFAAPTLGPSCNFPTTGQSGTGTITLAPNGTCNFGITYTAGTPPGNAVSNATLSVTDTASGSPQTAPIQGTPIALGVILLPVSFGAVTVGTTSPTMNATLSNFSGSSISVTSAFTISGTNQADFHLVSFVANGDGNPACSTTLPFPLASNASCDVSLTFTPSLPAGNETAQLNVTASVAVATTNPNLIGTGIEVTSILPPIVATGGPAFTLTVNGGGFASNAVVNVNGSARLTTFVNSTQLLASIPATDIATAGSLAISVTTPSPGGTQSEPKTLIVAQAPVATNDNIAFATDTSATPFRTTQDTTQATTNTAGVTDPTPPSPSCAPATAALSGKARSVWFQFKAPATGKVAADTRFSSYTTILSVWTGTPGSFTLPPVACSSGNITGTVPQSLVTFNVTSGTTYFVMVTDASAAGAGGTLTFSLDFASAPPVNDDNAAPTIIAPTAIPYSNSVNSILATANTNGNNDPALPPGCATGAVNSGHANSVWYVFNPPSNGTMTADTLTSPYDTILTAATGTPGNLTAVACNDNAAAGIAESQISFAATGNTAYFFMVSSVLGDGGTTNFHLTFSATTGPIATLSPSPVPFGNQRVNTTGTAVTVTLTNSGTSTLMLTASNAVTITGTNASDFTIASGTTCTNNASVAANGGTCFINLTFKPGAVGARTATLTVTDNASPTTQSVTLNGTGIAPIATVTPSPLAFGNQRKGTTSAAMAVTVKNTGTDTLNLAAANAVVIGGANAADFANAAGSTCASSTALAPNASCIVNITFTPSTTTAEAATLTITDDSNAVVGSTQVVNLTGTGIFPIAAATPSPLAFGNVPKNTTGGPLTVTLTNSGTDTLHLAAASAVALSGTNASDFAIASGTTCINTATVAAGGGTCIINVTFTPSTTAAEAATLTITDDASPTTQTVSLTGTGTAASVTLAPSPVNFGNQRINTTSAPTTVTLTNSGNASVTLSNPALSITGTNATDFVVAAGTGTTCTNGAVIAAAPGPGNTCVINVTFTPGSTGARTATLQVTDSATPGTQSVTLNGTGTVPTASVAPLNIPFGNQRKGTTSAGQDVTVSNTGTDTLNIASIVLGGTNPTQFVLGPPSSGTACSLTAATAVAAAGNCKFSVKFGPTATGAQAATVTITDDSGGTAGTTQTVTLSGTGTLPQASAAPNPLAFGNQRKGTTSAALTVTLTNTGTDTLNLAAASAVAISGTNAADFTVGTGTTCNNSTAVTPNGGTCIVNVTFTPSTTAAEAATLTFTDDSGGVAGTTQVVSLTGTGVFPQAAPAPTTLPFGNQPKNITSAPQTITLTNGGTDTLHLAASSAVSFTGTNASDFAVATGTTCINSATVAPNGTCIINVTFTPSTTTAETATLTITDDANPTTQTVSLTGTGVTATVTFAPSPEPFGNQRVGTTSAPLTMTLTNSGNGSVTLAAANAVTLSGGNAADFAITGGTCANGLPLAAAPGPGNTCTVTATFTPSALGGENTTLTVTFQGATPAATDNLTGTGVFPQATPSPNPVNFNNQVINTTSAAMTVTLTNGGTDTLHLAASNAAVIGGANAGDFAMASGTTCINSATVAPGANCIINLAFTPSALNARTATLTITDDANPTTQVVTLNGTGTNPAPTITTLSPNNAIAGGASFVLTITGTNFVAGATVNFGTNPALTPTTNTGVQIVVTVPAADIAVGGLIPVTVTNPAPGGGDSAPATFTINNPVPTITTLSPTSATAGGAAFTLTVNGTNFVTGQSLVKFNGNPKTTTVVSTTQVTAPITAADIATAGTFPVTVTSAAPGGGTSAPTNFTVNNPVPTLTSIAPTSGVLGQSVNLTLTGTGFVSGSIVNFGTNADSGGVVTNGGATLTITIPAAQLNAAGPVSVTVTNPAPGGGTTTAQTFTVNNPAPTLTSIAPTSGVLGQSVNLTLTGTNFIAGSIVNFGANADSGGVVSNGGNTLTITIPAAQLNVAGTVSVTVTNPAPGGGTSAAAQFTINNPQPAITSLSPSSTAAGGAAFTLTINGSNFITGAKVDFGSDKGLTPTSVTAAVIMVTIPAADIATGGTPNVVVNNPAPAVGPSAPSPFTVNNPAPTLTNATSGGQTHVAGGAAFTLTVSGASFVSTSTVNFNGKAETTTFVSATQLTASIPAGDVATAGNVNVTVTNPAPGGGTSAAFVFIIDGYAVSGPANTTVKAGSQAMIQITVTPSAKGFANAIMFSVSGLPAHSTASFSPASVTPGTNVATTTLTINTMARGSAPPTAPENPPVPPLLRVLPFAWLAALLIAAYAMRLVRRVPQFRRYAVVVPLVLLLISGAVLAGCAGKAGTPAGPAQLTITATSGTLTQSTAPNSVTLTVQ